VIVDRPARLPDGDPANRTNRPALPSPSRRPGDRVPANRDRPPRPTGTPVPLRRCGGKTARWFPVGGFPGRSHRPVRTIHCVVVHSPHELPREGPFRPRPEELDRRSPVGHDSAKSAGQTRSPGPVPRGFPLSDRLTCGAVDPKF